MDNLLYAIIFFVVALGMLIAIHEYGHYWVARKMGVKVLRFSIGFGRVIWSTKRGEDQTEYAIAAIPLGGYVKMLDEREEPVEPAEQHRAFNRKSLGARFAIVAAGPAFNFAFAILVYWMVFMLGIAGVKPLVGSVEPNSPFAEAGIMAGDEIVSVRGSETPTLETVRLKLMDAVLGDKLVPIEYQRGVDGLQSTTLDLSNITAESIDADFMLHLGFTPQRPEILPIIDQLQDGGAAEKAGFKSGDKVISVDGKAMDDWMAWANYIRERPEQKMAVLIERDGAEMTLDVTPARIETATGSIGRVGATPYVSEESIDVLRATQQYGILEAVPAAIGKTWDMSILTLQMLWKMIVGEASIENISGPITIASYAGQTAQIGLVPFLSFLAIVSVSLGVLNLLPVPILDGGHLMYYVVEFFKGSPVSEEAQVIGQKIGIVLLGGLMFIALFNDFSRVLG